MRQFTLQVVETATFAGQLAVSCRFASGGQPRFAPGQAFLARREAAPPGAPRQPLFPYLASQTPVYQVPPAHALAQVEPGERLDLLGPCGRGFDLPPRPGRLLVIAAALDRLQGLLLEALAQRWAVVVMWPAEALLPDLPPEVEIHRGGLSAELVTWADLLALDLPDPAPLARAARALAPLHPAGFIQALITPPMPCGTGGCQACWVAHPPGRGAGGARSRLACVDGPVFRF